MKRPAFLVLSRLLLLLVVAAPASGCTALRRWLVPPATHRTAADVGYSHDRRDDGAELILVVASLPGGPTQETAIAVRDGHILARGTLAAMEPMRTNTTQTIRLPGGVAMPGLVAAHVRLEPAAMATDVVDLRNCKSTADVADALKLAKPQVLSESGWLWADGISLALFDKLSSADLDRALGRTAVLVTPAGRPNGVSSAGLGNGALLARLGDLGTAIAERRGRFNDAQVRLAWQQLPPARPERLKPLLLALFADVQRQGVTEVHAFAVSGAALEALRMLDRESRLTVRTRVYLDAERPEGQALLAPNSPSTRSDAAQGQQSIQQPPPQTKRVPLVQVAGVSLELDGSVVAATAAMTEPYLDLPHAGTLTYSDEALRARLEQADRAGLQVAVRASGDEALAQLVRVATAMQRDPRLPALRVELPEVVSPATLDWLQEAHAQCVIAPPLLQKDFDLVRRRLGPLRWPEFDRAASLAAACPLQVALDFVHPEAMRSHDHLTRHGGNDAEAMSAQQAWRALSSGGTARTTPPVQIGEDADLVVWSRDPLLPGKVPAKVMASMVGGTLTLLIGREVDSN
jgi:predicted amidohydrolase YtcJ